MLPLRQCAGPCQFPTLGFVVEQYEKIQAFEPEDFWYIYASLERDDNNVVFTWKRHRLFDWHASFVLYETCVAEPEAIVLAVQTKPTKKWCA